MAGPVYHYQEGLPSKRKFPVEFDKALFIYDWERSWIKIVRLDGDGRLLSIQPFIKDIKIKRPISLSFGPDGALYLVEWGTAWSNNKDAQVVRIEPAL